MVAPLVLAAGAQGLGSIAGGIAGYNGSKKAAAAQARAIAAAQNTLRGYADKSVDALNTGAGQSYGYLDNGLNSATQAVQPWADWGGQGLNKLAYYMSTPERTREMVTSDPSYQFRLDEGLNALNNSGSAAGMTLSGDQMKALNRYGQDFASNEFQNAYSRLMNQSNTGLQVNNQIGDWRYGTGQGKANTAMGTAGNISNVYQNTGNALADLIVGGGNAAAAGKIGQANALAGMFNGIGKAAGSYLGGK